jgi:ubiquinone biosynthesis protein
MTWREGIEALRRATQAELPELVRRRTLPPLSRMIRTLFSIGGALGGWLAVERRRGGADSVRGISHRLRRAFERLGSSYIKLGQIISAGQGVFPDELVDEFRLCRDRVAPETFETVQRVVEEDLGRPLAEVFAAFEREPLAAASIAQVHAARLASGEDVVVKVQRPQVQELVRRDIETMAWIAPWLIGRIPVAALANPPALVELFAETILEELDFRLEAENMLDVARMLAEAKQTIFVVPRPHPRLVTRRVLVMERLRGFAYEDVEAMRRAGVDTAAMLRAAFIAFLEGAMIYGVFHGDMHGGNMFVLADGRIALLDYGITARMTPLQRGAFLRMLMTGAVNDLRGQLAAFRDLGALPPDTDLDAVVRDLKLDQPVRDPTKMTPEELVEEIRGALKALLGYGARLPKPLMLYVKNLIFLDGAVARFAPDVNLFDEVAHIFQYFAGRHGERISREVGIDPRAQGVDLDGMRAGLGLEGPVTSITHRELQERRALIQKRMEKSRGELRRRLRKDLRA